MPSSTASRVAKAQTSQARIQRVSSTPRRPGEASQVHPLLHLQQSIGNRAVGRLISTRRLVQRDVIIVPPDPDLNKPIPGGTDDESTFCKPYATKAKALRRRDELMVNAVLPLTATFGKAVGSLWAQYLFGGTPPREITDKSIIDAFATDETTVTARSFVMTRVFDALAKKPELEDGTHLMEELLPVGLQTDIEQKFNWSNPFSTPGNIAGGLGKDQVSSPIGARPSPINDSRVVRGSVVIATDAAGRRSATVKPVISVDDTIDLCPGDPGSLLEQNLTNPLSKCEASSVSGDVPYHLNFSMPPETRPIAPAKPDPPPPPVPVTIPSNVLFEFNSAVVTAAGEEALVLALGDRPKKADLSQGVNVIGHTDSKGAEDFNQRLSVERARAVAKVLERRFPNLQGSLRVAGRGEREPVAPNEIGGKDNPEGRRLNRRVVVELASTP